MAYTPDTMITLKDGIECLLRNALPGDARDVRSFTIEAAKTSEYLVMLPDEITETHWRTREKLKRYLDAEDELVLIALDGPMVVGQLMAVKTKRARLAHGIDMGIAIKDGWRGRGLGRAMIEFMIKWAETAPRIERIELHVHSENHTAIHLYESLGFEHEGRRRKAIKYADGRYMDDLIMAKLLERTPRLDIRYI